MNKQDVSRYWRKVLGQANVALTGASDIALQVQLSDVLEEFFDGSNCWQEHIEFVAIPETVEYPLRPLTGRVLRLLAVLDQHNIPQQAVMPSIETVRFLYPYTVSQPMTALVIKTVTDPLLCFPPNIPDWLLPTHGLGILHGLLGNMMLQPGQSYSNPQLANFHLVKFRDAIAHARVAAMKANTVGAQSWIFPQSHRVSGQRGGISTFNVHPAIR